VMEDVKNYTVVLPLIWSSSMEAKSRIAIN